MKLKILLKPLFVFCLIYSLLIPSHAFMGNPITNDDEIVSLWKDVRDLGIIFKEGDKAWVSLKEVVENGKHHQVILPKIEGIDEEIILEFKYIDHELYDMDTPVTIAMMTSSEEYGVLSRGAFEFSLSEIEASHSDFQIVLSRLLQNTYRQFVGNKIDFSDDLSKFTGVVGSILAIFSILIYLAIFIDNVPRHSSAINVLYGIATGGLIAAAVLVLHAAITEFRTIKLRRQNMFPSL